MPSAYNYNTKSKEMSDSKIYKISNLTEELVENFKKCFTDTEDEIIKLKEVTTKNIQNEKKVEDVATQLREKIISLESKSNSVECQMKYHGDSWNS